MAVSPQINFYRNQRSDQLLIMDLRPAESADTYRYILSGGRLYPSDRLLPARSDFRDIWLALDEMGGAFVGTAQDMVHRMHKGALTCVCLKVFQELALVNMEYCDEEIRVKLNKTNSKTDLTSSTLLRSLF